MKVKEKRLHGFFRGIICSLLILCFLTPWQKWADFILMGEEKGNSVTAFLNMPCCYITSVPGKTESVVLLNKIILSYHLKYIYITEDKGKEKKGKEMKGKFLAYSLTAFLLSIQISFPFLSSSLSLAVRMENSALDCGVFSESRPVVLALIDLSPFPLL